MDKFVACREAFYDRTFHGSFDAAHGNYDAHTFGGLKIVFRSRAAKGGWELINETSVLAIMEAGKRDLPLRGSWIIFIKGQFMLLPSLHPFCLLVQAILLLIIDQLVCEQPDDCLLGRGGEEVHLCGAASELFLQVRRALTDILAQAPPI